MRTIIISAFVCFFLASCGSKADKKTGDDAGEKNTGKEEVTDITQNADYQKGLALIAKSDCLTCHKVDEMVTGPAYRDVANKYAGLPDTIVRHLAGKIISGGKGVWGEVVMLPHPAISQEDAEAMVKYILLLKK